MSMRNANETAPLLNASTSQDVAQTNEIPNGTADHNGEAVESTKAAAGETAYDEERQNQHEGEEEPYAGMPEVKARLKYIVPAIGMGIFLSAADQTIIVSCYGKIGSDLKALNKTSWISTAYFLSLTSIQPLYGKLSDIFGRKACLIFAYSIFGIGCLLCGLASTMDELIVARAFAGVGGGGMTTVVSILMSDIVPLRERGTWQGIINIIYASGAGCGAPLGGVLADYVGWRWAFLGQAPMCALAIASVALALKLPQKDVLDWKTKLRRIDFLGASILILAVFALLLGLDRGSNGSWSSPLTITSLCLAIPLFASFVLVEFRFAGDNAIAPRRIVFERSLIACYLCNFFAFASWMALLFYLPLFFQAVDRLSASQAGVRLLPAIAASVTGSLAGGLIMQKTGKYYWLTVIAYAVSATAMLAVLLFSGVILNTYVGIAIGLAFSGLGNGVGVTTTLIGLIANASREDLAVATACSYLFRSLGSVVGVSLAATVVQQSLRFQLEQYLEHGRETDIIVQNVRQSLEYIRSLDSTLQDIVRNCYGEAIRHGFLFAFCLAVGAAFSSWFIQEKKLSR